MSKQLGSFQQHQKRKSSQCAVLGKKNRINEIKLCVKSVLKTDMWPRCFKFKMKIKKVLEMFKQIQQVRLKLDL